MNLDSREMRCIVYDSGSFIVILSLKRMITFEASPIKEVSSLNIGPRPAARKTITEISGLVRFPGYSHGHKNRIMFPGWYGGFCL